MKLCFTNKPDLKLASVSERELAALREMPQSWPDFATNLSQEKLTVKIKAFDYLDLH